MMQDQGLLFAQGAGFPIRFVAYVIDVVVLLIIEVLCIAIFKAPGFFLAAIAGLVYTVGFWTARGATPGKSMLGLRVVRQDGTPMDLGTAVVRYIGYVISGAVLGLGFLWILWDPMHEGWHDKIARTRVIRQP